MRIISGLLLAVCLRAQYTPIGYNGGPTSSPAVLVTNYSSGVDNTPDAGTTITNPSLKVYLKYPFFLSGNCAVLSVSYDSGDYTISTPTDDGSETWTAGPTKASGNATLASYYVLGTTSSTRVITIAFTGSTQNDTLFGATVTQVRNCSTAAIGGTGSTSFTANSAAHSLTLNASPSSGDFVWQTAWDTSQPDPTAVLANAITVGSGFTFVSDSISYGKEVEYCTTCTSTSVPITYAGTDAIISIGLVIKQGSSGSTPPATKYIANYQVENYGSAGAHVTHFPCSGNLIVGLVTSPDASVSSATSTTTTATWTNTHWETGTQTSIASIAQIIFGVNATCSAAGTITPVLSGSTVGYIEIAWVDVANAAAAPFDNAHATQNINQTTNANLTCDTITPGTQGDLVFNVCTIDFHTITGTVADSNSHTPTLLQSVNTKADNGATTNGTGPSTLDEDDGRAYYINSSDTNALSFIYANTTSLANGPTGTEDDVGVSVAFK